MVVVQKMDQTLASKVAGAGMALVGCPAPPCQQPQHRASRAGSRKGLLGVLAATSGVRCCLLRISDMSLMLREA
jgi:hypothetical protein